MPTQKRTSKAKSPATQQPSQLEAPERIRRLIGLYRGHAEQFDQDDRSQETQVWAYVYWREWPLLLGSTLHWVKKSAPAVSDEYKLRIQPREQLTQTHEAATRYLMREAVRRNLYPSPLQEESRYCRELLKAWYDRAVWGGESTAPAFRSVSEMWPDILGEQRYELPTVLQQAITDGEGFFSHLMTVLEIDAMAAKVQTAEVLKIPLGNDEPTEPATVNARMLEAGAAKHITHPTGQQSTRQDDTKNDTLEKTKKKPRKMTTAAFDCARLYKTEKKKDSSTTIKSVVEDYVDDNDGSVGGIIRTLNDNPDQWKE